MNYPQAVAYLENLKPAGIQMGLERVRHACEMLHHPERNYPTVHIAGTNGKGSTARMIAAMLTANGYRTGLYTSPAVTDLRDMILIDSSPVIKERFASCVGEIAAIPLHGLTEYECLTAAVFLCFAQEQVDIAVIECCLGGETDATNVIPPPLCAVFTPIALDHAAILGDNIEAIAGVKSGIIKPSCDVVCAASMHTDALGVIFEKASACGCTVHMPTLQADATVQPSGTRFKYEDKTVTLSMIGKHQHENAMTALTAMRCLMHRGFRFDTAKALRAIAEVTMPCRFEICSSDPLTVLDGAHNPHGIAVLCDTAKELGLTNGTLIIGMLADKDCEACLKMLAPLFDRILCCTPPNTPRAMDAAALAALAALYHEHVEIIHSPLDAWEYAKKTSKQTPIVVGGSFYTASVVREAIKSGR